MACEFLLLNGAKVDGVKTDADGNSPLHVAASNKRTAQVMLLLKHRADHTLMNHAGDTALEVALHNCDADTGNPPPPPSITEENRQIFRARVLGNIRVFVFFLQIFLTKILG